MIDRLTVYFHRSETIKLGTLAVKERKIYFEYDKDFLETNLQLSPYKLPLKSGVFRCDDDTFEGLWGLFADSLPDGWGRLLMDRHLMRQGVNPHSLSPLDRLAYVGSSGMGVLSYEPAHTVENEMDRIVLDDLAQSAQEILEGGSDDLLDELLALGGSSAGARPKVLVQISDDLKRIVHGGQTLKEGFGHWMVKFAAASDTPDAGTIEYAYSLMAGAAGLQMPRTALLEGKRGRYFAVERFDRIADNRVHMHSVAGLVHADFRMPTLDYDDLLRLTLHLTKNAKEMEKIFRLACFNLFAHNRDDHAKNFSFLMDEAGEWHLSPAYDITFSYGPGGEHSTMYLNEGKNPTEKQLMALAKKHGIRQGTAIIDEVKEAVSGWRRFAEEAGVNPKDNERIAAVLDRLLAG